MTEKCLPFIFFPTVCYENMGEEKNKKNNYDLPKIYRRSDGKICMGGRAN
jgi:predicted nucleotide-binding protein (sugar kinase/HSP70/actin superfamily)